MVNCNHPILAIIVCLFFLSSCNKSENSANKNSDKVFFTPTFNGNSLTCDSIISLENKPWHYSQLQFFISTIELKDNNEKWSKASLATSAFQTDNTALLGEHCNHSNIKNKANWVLNFNEKMALSQATHIRFTLGLPFAVNHLNPLTQESPLNIPTMFWGWQKGHKFLRLEMATDSDNWLFHLGSVGCLAASPLRAPKQECRYPNRYTFELPLNKQNNQIVFELSALLNNLTITEQSSCQSSPDEKSCQILFSNLSQLGSYPVFQSNKTVITNND